MRAYLDRVASVIHRAPQQRTSTPRRQRPRRARSTFVPVGRDAALAY
ncbi:hypothetical protein SAMN04487846_2631 [Microbacterium sp. cf046]|nr:hypothetical protein [Microbacterium sp. cf046]SFS13219.1 hypothetical protein SAMN04487846_2631 [Microbacterium sp. cf046]